MLRTIRRKPAISSKRFSKIAKPAITLKSQAVLFRASHHSASLEVELTRRNIPFVKFGGLKFLEAAHIKDVLAVLRWAQNIRDRVAGFRVAQLLPGIGPSCGGPTSRSHGRKSRPDPSLERIQASGGNRRALARISKRQSACCAEMRRAGRQSLISSAAGMRRISSAFTRTRLCGRRTFVQLAQIAAHAIPAENAFSPNSRLIHRMRPATKPGAPSR